MPSIFDTWTQQTAEKVLADLQPDLISIKRAFVSGDHWQNGDGWVGPRPDLSDSKYQSVLGIIETQFVSRNVVHEVVDRHASGVVGIEPVWKLTPVVALKQDETIEPGTQLLIDEAEALLTEWWNDKGMHDMLRKAVFNAIWSDHGTVRFYIPPARLTATNLSKPTQKGTPKAGAAAQPASTPQPSSPTAPAKAGSTGNAVTAGPAATGAGGSTAVVLSSSNDASTGIVIASGDVRSALTLVCPEAPEPESCMVYVDPDTKETISIVVSEWVDENTGGATRKQIELEYIDAVSNETIIRIFDTVSGKPDGWSYNIPIGGHLLVHQISRDSLVSEQTMSSQRALNLALTMLPKNIVHAGFLERTILNAQMPGDWVEYTDVAGVKRQKFVPGQLTMGPGTTNFLRGIEVSNPDGSSTLTQPVVHSEQPVEVKNTIEAANFEYECVLADAKQTHVLMNADGRASGKSREQARADYEKSIQITKNPTEKVGRFSLMAVLALAEFLAGVPGRYTNTLRIDFECKIDLGPIPTEERTQNLQDVKSGIMSIETAMARSGILDVDAEKALINGGLFGQLALLEKQAEVLAQLVKIFTSTSEAQLAELVGMTPEQITLLALSSEPIGQAQAKLAGTVDANGNPIPPKASVGPDGKPLSGNSAGGPNGSRPGNIKDKAPGLPSPKKQNPSAKQAAGNN